MTDEILKEKINQIISSDISGNDKSEKMFELFEQQNQFLRDQITRANDVQAETVKSYDELIDSLNDLNSAQKQEVKLQYELNGLKEKRANNSFRFAMDFKKRLDKHKEVLNMLVNLKDIKDTQGKTDYYLKNQPLAWEKAKQIHKENFESESVMVLIYDCMFGVLEEQREYFNEHLSGKHPQEVMREIGITYEHATPRSVVDDWLFWNCENVPDKLPPFLRWVSMKPFEMIGRGLSHDDAVKITMYGK